MRLLCNILVLVTVNLIVAQASEPCTLRCHNGGTCRWTEWDCSGMSDCIPYSYMACGCPLGFTGYTCNELTSEDSMDESNVSDAQTTPAPEVEKLSTSTLPAEDSAETAEIQTTTVSPMNDEPGRECTLKCTNDGICRWKQWDCERSNHCIPFIYMECECPPHFDGSCAPANSTSADSRRSTDTLGSSETQKQHSKAVPFLILGAIAVVLFCIVAMYTARKYSGKKTSSITTAKTTETNRTPQTEKKTDSFTIV